MADHERRCFVYIQLPGTTETVLCASLRTKALSASAFEGTFAYNKQYLQRPDAIALDPFYLPLIEGPKVFTSFGGLPCAIRDAGPDAWGRRVVESRLRTDGVNLQGIDYLLNAPDDGVGN